MAFPTPAQLLRPLAERVLKQDIQVLTESISKLSEAVLELRAEERGWINVSQSFVPWEITGEERQRVIEKVRDIYKRNPLAGQIVDLKRYFTMGQGISFKAEDPEVNEVLRQFWQDDSNKWFLRQSQLSDDLEIDGEFFIRFFESNITGRVQVRVIPAWQITDIVTEAEDAETPLWYRREWVEQRWDHVTKLYAIVKYHTGVDADYIPANEILHVKIGAPLYAKFGNSPLYRVLNWLDAYKEWLEDRVKLNKAKATFVWKKKVKGLPGALAGMASSITSTLNKVVSGTEKVTPPKTGSVIVENDATEWSAVNPTIGADDASEDGRAIKLMICAGSGVFEHYLGDAKVGNLASTKSMELPMLKMFEWRQTLFQEAVFLPTFRRVIRAAVAAGMLPEKVKVKRQEGGKEIELEILTDQVYIDIDFPPLVLKEIKELTDALTKQVEAGFKSKQTAAMEVGIEDWDQEKAMMAAEQQEADARRRENDTNMFPPFDPGGNDDDEPGAAGSGKNTPKGKGKNGGVANGTTA